MQKEEKDSTIKKEKGYPFSFSHAKRKVFQIAGGAELPEKYGGMHDMAEEKKWYGEETRGKFDCPVELAQWLLGKTLCHKRPDGRVTRLVITETEAYDHDDPACYGYGGKTRDNAPLFEKGGTCCIYGEMLLIACGKEGEPDNVLIRRAGNETIYCGGPILVCEELGLEKADGGLDLLTSKALWLEGTDELRACCRTQRVGLSDTLDREHRDLRHRFILL